MNMAMVLDQPVAQTQTETLDASADFRAEVSEWLEAFDQLVAGDRTQAAALLGALRQHAGAAGVEVAGALNDALPEHNRSGRRGAVSRRPRQRAAGRGADPLECDGDGALAE